MLAPALSERNWDARRRVFTAFFNATSVLQPYTQFSIRERRRTPLTPKRCLKTVLFLSELTGGARRRSQIGEPRGIGMSKTAVHLSGGQRDRRRVATGVGVALTFAAVFGLFRQSASARAERHAAMILDANTGAVLHDARRRRISPSGLAHQDDDALSDVRDARVRAAQDVGQDHDFRSRRQRRSLQARSRPRRRDRGFRRHHGAHHEVRQRHRRALWPKKSAARKPISFA